MEAIRKYVALLTSRFSRSNAEIIFEVERLLRLSYTKMRIAQRFVYDRRIKRDMLFMTAVTRNPMLLPTSMSSIYYNSSIKDVKKALKLVRSMKIDEENAELLYSVRLLEEKLAKLSLSKINQFDQIIVSVFESLENVKKHL